MNALLLALSCAASAAPAGLAAPAAPAPKVVHFKTSDGWALAAKYAAPPKGGAVAILVHGVGASKEEWQPLEDELAKRGIGTLAVDLRGHGESQKGEVVWPKAVEDLIAAARWAKEHGAGTVGFVGGSIGANLSSQAAPLVGAKWMVLLSPGIDYRGVACAPPGKTPTLAAAAPADAYAFRTAQLVGGQGATFVQTKGGHGAQMLIQPDFMQKLGDWISTQASPASSRKGAQAPAQRKK